MCKWSDCLPTPNQHNKVIICLCFDYGLFDRPSRVKNWDNCLWSVEEARRLSRPSVARTTDLNTAEFRKCITELPEDAAMICSRKPNMFSRPLSASRHRAARLWSARLCMSRRPWPNTHTGQRLDISSDIFCAHILPSPLGLSAREEQWGLPPYQGIDFIKLEQQPWLNYRLRCRMNALALHGANWYQKMLFLVSGWWTILIKLSFW